jgi:predicted transposase/invertase (TIGR01784 family)
MLLTEWNWDDAKEVWQAEAREEGIEQGIERGREEGIETKALEVAKNLIKRGQTLEDVSEITGLDLGTIAHVAGKSR